jgi:hypothetical protein
LDCALGNAYLAGELCGGVSLRMTHLFFILDLPERKRRAAFPFDELCAVWIPVVEGGDHRIIQT